MEHLPAKAESLALQAGSRLIYEIQQTKGVVLQLVPRGSWVDMDGEPYLTAEGTSVIARFFGVSLVDVSVEEIREELNGKATIRFVAKVTAEIGGRRVQDEGCRSTTDPFFGVRYVDGKKTLLPLDEVNLAAVRKAAVTNAKSRALKTLLGLEGLTWEEIEASGVSRGRSKAVDYKSKKRPGGAGTSSRVKLDLKNMILDLAHETTWGEASEAILREVSSYTDKDGKAQSVHNLDAIPDAWAERLLKKVRPQWDQEFGNLPEEPSPREPGE